MPIEQLLGPAREGWDYTSLGEACKRGGGDIQTGPFGSQLHAADYVRVGVPSIMPLNIGDNRIVEEGIARITREDAKRLSRYLVRRGDIVYSRRGDVERRALVRSHEDGWLCGTGCLRVRLGETGVDPHYASYYLGHPSVREWIVRHAHGATMPNLNTSILSACPLLVPPQREQRAIARVLGTLDDKIEVNAKMSETLEEIARTIFKWWFVDFGPVRAKAEGRDPGLPKSLSDLFPSRFVQSELGSIPEGWSVRSLGEVSDCVRGRAYKSSQLDDSPTALVTLKSFRRQGGYRAEGLKPYTGPFKPEQVVTPGEVVVACTDVTQAADVVGRPAIVERNPLFESLVASLDVLVVRPRASSFKASYLYALLSDESFVSHAYAYTSGTTVLHLDRKCVPAYHFVSPSDEVLSAFTDIVDLVRERTASIREENQTLSAMRDSLLPKLISGEVRLDSMRA